MTERLITSNKPLGAKLSLCWWRDVEVIEQVPWRAVQACVCVYRCALICVCVWVVCTSVVQRVSSGVFRPAVWNTADVLASPPRMPPLSLHSLSSSSLIRTYPPMFIRRCSSHNKPTSVLIPPSFLPFGGLFLSLSLHPSPPLKTHLSFFEVWVTLQAQSSVLERCDFLSSKDWLYDLWNKLLECVCFWAAYVQHEMFMIHKDMCGCHVK